LIYEPYFIITATLLQRNARLQYEIYFDASQNIYCRWVRTV